MNVYRIYPLLIDLISPLCFGHKGGEHCFVFTLTPLLMIDKKGEKYFRYICMFWKRILVYAYCFVLQIGEKEFDVFHTCLCMFISLYLHTCL